MHGTWGAELGVPGTHREGRLHVQPVVQEAVWGVDTETIHLKQPCHERNQRVQRKLQGYVRCETRKHNLSASHDNF